MRLAIAGIACLAFILLMSFGTEYYDIDELRKIYSGPSAEWPKPNVDADIDWKELAARPASPYKNVDSLKAKVALGKSLFFDPRLSSSGQISCSSCHDPQLGWSNGRTVSVGHDHQLGQRNVPSLLNIWANESFFWDGSAKSLEEQAYAPLKNPVEMHQDVAKLPAKLKTIKGYKPLFEEAFGDSLISTVRIISALADFERSITSKKNDFDRFMEGHDDALSDEAVLGLHLFRTKARCINCHYGPFFTDNDFHNLGLHYYGRKYEDLGRYHVTQNPEDMGKFKTPGLRDVAYTDPYMHNGLFPTLIGVINIYNHGGSRPKPRPEFADDPHFPQTSERLLKLNLTDNEKQALLAFLHSISTIPYRMPRPDLPE